MMVMVLYVISSRILSVTEIIPFPPENLEDYVDKGTCYVSRQAGCTEVGCPVHGGVGVPALTCSPSRPMILGIEGPQMSTSSTATWHTGERG